MWMEKGIKNVDAIAYKLRPISPKVINNRLEVARKKRQNKKEVKEKEKAEVIVVKQCKAKRKMSLFSEKQKENDTRNDTYPDQAQNK